jgi:hypothetical protein
MRQMDKSCSPHIAASSCHIKSHGTSIRISNRSPSAMRSLLLFIIACGCSSSQLNGVEGASDECSLTPVIHVLQYPGCVPKPIPSFACIGRCGSYVQVSGSKIWQMERSCNCCQESGEREASVSLFCPKAKVGERKFRKV